ncbi:unnamed protein product [Ophioblennius macclurei]
MMSSPPSATLRIKRKNYRHVRRPLCLKGANGQDKQGHRWQRQPSHAKMGNSCTWVIQHQEMDSFLRLFDDELIQNFLMMDSCYKMSDKYLLAMTFVYFKRACFTAAEFTRDNFFIALYLANCIEEEEENAKYEIFPWALGKSWRKQFPRFLLKRDKLWASMEFRAVVSRTCCEEVMAIKSSHFVWHRQRSDYHSGAKREFGDPSFAICPRGPHASPVSCAQCTRRMMPPLRPAASSKGKAGASGKACPKPLTSAQHLEVTPPRPAKSRATHFKARAPEESPRNMCRSTGDLFMDWMNEE